MKETAPRSQIEQFLLWAQKGEWVLFDEEVDRVCDDPSWVSWASEGLVDLRINVRDLAISILEKTKVPVGQEQLDELRSIMSRDEDNHLRRKAAIALFARGARDLDVMGTLKEAQANDDELKDIVAGLFSSLNSAS